METITETHIIQPATQIIQPPTHIEYTPFTPFQTPILRTQCGTLVSVDFEVYGVVQGVFFPKFCRDMAQSLGLKGWVRNTRKGTILGVMQGEKERVDDMAMWLRLQGSPGSRIEQCTFHNWTIIDGHDFKEFRILY